MSVEEHHDIQHCALCINHFYNYNGETIKKKGIKENLYKWQHNRFIQGHEISIQAAKLTLHALRTVRWVTKCLFGKRQS